MSQIPDEQKPAISKVIAPLPYLFPLAALLTILLDLFYFLNGYLYDAMTLSISSGIPKHTVIGIGMY